MKTIVAGKYEIIKIIAKGGMAEVFLAKQNGIDGFEKLVVLKTILPHLASNGEYIKMFLDEARTVADLRHNNIVSVYEVGHDDGIYYIAMEYLHGLDLKTICENNIKHKQSLPWVYAVGIIIDAASGLHYAHTKTDFSGEKLAIVHRDISPHNLVITIDGVCKVVDFGVSKAKNHTSNTESGIVKGKYSYMAPEQVMGKELDNKADIFSLAIILYEITTSKRLFKKDTNVATINAIASCKFIKPSDVIDNYPKDLEAILLKALSKNPQDRYSSCQKFKEALEDYLSKNNLNYSASKLSKYLRKYFSRGKNKPIFADATKLYISKNYIGEQTQEYKYSDNEITIANKSAQKNSTTKIISILLIILTISIFISWLLKPTFNTLTSKINSIKKENNSNISADKKDHNKRTSKQDIFKKNNIKMGRLKIIVYPWASVYINGKRLGTTPLPAQKLPIGTYEVKIINPKLGKRIVQNVKILSDKDSYIRANWLNKEEL